MHRENENEREREREQGREQERISKKEFAWKVQSIWCIYLMLERLHELEICRTKGAELKMWSKS